MNYHQRITFKSVFKPTIQTSSFVGTNAFVYVNFMSLKCSSIVSYVFSCA